jgi:glycosyltransferase involved in cell wall biosynthesis
VTRQTIAAIVCAFDEARYLPACLHSLLSQTRLPDELIVVNNASTDTTGEVARAVPGVRVIDEPTKGLVVAREAARRAASSRILAYLDADCRAPIGWVERLERRFVDSRPDAVTGPYRFYDWDWTGRALIRGYDVLVAPPTHLVVHRALRLGAILYGGNFAVRAAALEAIGGFDQSVEFHGEDTNLGRRLTAAGGRVAMAGDCWVWTSARRYRAMGKGQVFGLYIRNFCSELLRHRPADRDHLDVRA